MPSPAGQRPLHPGFAQHAQAQVQAQALALGAGEGFMNPGVMLGGMRPSGTPDTPALVPAGINPLALMGGGGAGNGPPGPFGGGPGPMLTGGGWGEGAFSS